jgi:hemerythrin-like domain-containing protein
MCQHCGCQAIAAIDELTREHDRLTDLIGHIRIALAGGDLAHARSICAGLASVLVPHTAVEELALFPALADEHGEHIDGLLEEHALLHRALAVVAADVNVRGGWSRQLLDALAVLRLHILKEQDGVFPAALAALSTEDWLELDRVRRAVERRQAPDALAG